MSLPVWPAGVAVLWSSPPSCNTFNPGLADTEGGDWVGAEEPMGQIYVPCPLSKLPDQWQYVNKAATPTAPSQEVGQ